MITVVKKGEYTPSDFVTYIGRGSVLGNPYDFKNSNHPQVKYQVKNRIEAIKGFEKYLSDQIKNGEPEFCDAINNIFMLHNCGKDVQLECFCAPCSCHGDVIKEFVERQKYCINWFSNMRKMDEPLVYQGVEYHTSENFYQAMKTKDLVTREFIADMNPFQAKIYAKKIDLREDWSDIKLDVMRYILKFKFAPNTSWGKKLREYKDEIVEFNNWRDFFWGRDFVTGKGENYLGKILMEIRDEV